MTRSINLIVITSVEMCFIHHSRVNNICFFDFVTKEKILPSPLISTLIIYGLDTKFEFGKHWSVWRILLSKGSRVKRVEYEIERDRISREVKKNLLRKVGISKGRGTERRCRSTYKLILQLLYDPGVASQCLTLIFE